MGFGPFEEEEVGRLARAELGQGTGEAGQDEADERWVMVLVHAGTGSSQRGAALVLSDEAEERVGVAVAGRE